MAENFVGGIRPDEAARPNLLTVRRAADLLTVSTRKVYNLISEGQLPHYRIDNVIRIAEEDVEDYLADCRIARQPLVVEHIAEAVPRTKKPRTGQSAVKTSHLTIGPRQLSLLRRGGVAISGPSDRSGR